MDFANYWASATSTADLGDTIEQSLRFPNTPTQTENALLTKTGATSSTWTASFWAKWAGLGNGYVFSQGGTEGFRGGNSDSDSRPNYFIDSNHRYTSGEHNDPSAWYHYVISYDGSNIKIYVNGALDLTYATGNGSISLNRIGGYNGSIAFAGYLAAFYWVDGSALTATSFGKYNDDGVWVPQNYSGSFGSNGFKLTFDSSQSPNGVGTDSSGNGNHWTASGFDTSAISSSNKDNDVDFKDTPTSNYPTWQPLGFNNGKLASSFALSKGNLTYTVSSDPDIGLTIFTIPTSGKYYFEVYAPSVEGIIRLYAPADSNQSANYVGNLAYFFSQSSQWSAPNYAGSLTPQGSASKSPTGSVDLQIAIDADNHKIYLSDGNANNWLRNAGSGTYTVGAFSASHPAIDYSGLSEDARNNAQLAFTGYNGQSLNCGQMDFVYTPPTGFTDNDLQSNTLPEPTIKNGKDHFEAVTYTGNGSTQTITGLEFQPDLIWCKARSVGFHHVLTDSVRGASKSMNANLSNAEQTQSTSFVQSFNSDGWTMGDSATGTGGMNTNNDTYVAWCWKGGGTAVSNSDGSITSSVSANTDAGFSIVSYTGTGSNATVGHGLDSAPEFVITKERGNTRNWAVYHKGSGNNNILFLNLNNAQSAAAEYWQNTDPTTSVFSIGTSTYVNNSSGNYIAYCWHSVEGFSKFGKFTGNSSTDGPFIYLGFRPAFFMWKKASGSGNWEMRDTTRVTSNPDQFTIYANQNYSEAGPDTLQTIDILSNGVKIRNSQSNMNQGTLIYAAFAENPFGGENTPPVTAR